MQHRNRRRSGQNRWRRKIAPSISIPFLSKRKLVSRARVVYASGKGRAKTYLRKGWCVSGDSAALEGATPRRCDEGGAGFRTEGISRPRQREPRFSAEKQGGKSVFCEKYASFPLTARLFYAIVRIPQKGFIFLCPFLGRFPCR